MKSTLMPPGERRLDGGPGDGQIDRARDRRRARPQCGLPMSTVSAPPAVDSRRGRERVEPWTGSCTRPSPTLATHRDRVGRPGRTRDARDRRAGVSMTRSTGADAAASELGVGEAADAVAADLGELPSALNSVMTQIVPRVAVDGRPTIKPSAPTPVRRWQTRRASSAASCRHLGRRERRGSRCPGRGASCNGASSSQFFQHERGSRLGIPAASIASSHRDPGITAEPTLLAAGETAGAATGVPCASVERRAPAHVVDAAPCSRAPGAAVRDRRPRSASSARTSSRRPVSSCRVVAGVDAGVEHRAMHAAARRAGSASAGSVSSRDRTTRTAARCRT